MDFKTIFQLRTKRFWWMDVIFYFSASLLIAAVFCYLIFLAKDVLQKADIKQKIIDLENVGTEEQKRQEKEVMAYQKKIGYFSEFLKNHEFASNVFAFMEKQTLPNIWFKQFSLNKQSSDVQLSGEAESLDALSREISGLEKNEYVKKLSGLSSSLGSEARSQFSVTLNMDPKIFSALSDLAPLIETVTASDEPVLADQEQKENQRLITAFHLRLDPEAIAVIDQEKYTVNLTVPYGTDVTNLVPAIDISPGSAVIPGSNVPQNFTTPIIYKVVAPDTTTQDYLVTVNVLPLETGQKEQSPGAVMATIIISILVLVAVIGLVVFYAWKKMQTKNAKIGSIK